MKSGSQLVSVIVFTLAALTAASATAEPVPADVGPQFESIGPLTFGPDGVLFAADNKAARVYAIQLGAQTSGNAKGAADITGIDHKVAAMLGTDAREIQITDLAVAPSSHNAFLAAHRGEGVNARAVLLRVDGDGAIDVVALDKLSYTTLDISNAPDPEPNSRRDPRASTITDMAYVDGRLFLAGLSNEEFASKLRSVRYPFERLDAGTSVEIYHGAHGQWETRSPVYTFVPFDVDDKPHLIAGYLCTPLVKFPIDQLESGDKLVGTTIAELGNRNRPLDMIVYSKDGKDYILMSNTSRGVMKISTEGFGGQDAITAPVKDGGTAGVAYETVASLQGIEQLDLYDEAHTIVITRSDAGELSLAKVALP